MPTLSDLKPAEGIVALVVGMAGSGKTSAICSFASKEAPMYIFDIDHRIRGILGSTAWLGDAAKYITYDQYDTRDGFSSIEKQFQYLYDLQEKRQLPYKNILIESVGSLSEMFHLDSLANKGARPGQDLSTLKPDQRKGMKIVGNIAFPTPDDYHYGKRAFHILFYNYFTAFPKCNIFLSGWTTERWGKNPNDENPYAPDILLPGKKLLATNKIASELPGYFDEIWEFEKEELASKSNPVKFTVNFKSFLAKTTIPILNKTGKLDITEKNFKEEFTRILNSNLTQSERKATAK